MSWELWCRVWRHGDKLTWNRKYKRGSIESLEMIQKGRFCKQIHSLRIISMIAQDWGGLRDSGALDKSPRWWLLVGSKAKGSPPPTQGPELLLVKISKGSTKSILYKQEVLETAKKRQRRSWNKAIRGPHIRVKFLFFFWWSWLLQE